MPQLLSTHPIHLGVGGAAVPQAEMTDGMEWYADYSTRHGGDGPEGRLISMYTFTESWDVWEMHPKGSEVVLCTAGEITLVQEMDGNENRVTLTAGEYAINDPGVWHTADVDREATAVFMTAGEGTEHRER